ncbi:MAG: U32 family peptidase [bacterium]
MMNKLELLSPAKNLESGIAAINCGADAVYIGAPKFSARSAAGNSIKDIERLIQYAHKYWTKVYVAVNTIIYDEEIKDVLFLIHRLYEMSTDAIIIQDMGLLEMDLPPIPIIASTQTHNYSLDKIKFLEDIGIQRVILARELSMEKIKNIKANTKLELEFFVHGALCVCFSGQCYFSYATTGRSANRGECSQPCRMLYSMEDGDGNEIIRDRYLLSLKDLNLSSHLKELIDAGISSFKIEGRLKDRDYVKNVTAFYRQKLDAIIDSDSNLKSASSGKVIFDFTPDPEKTFNRGYTNYFVKSDDQSIASMNTPKSTGKFIGAIKRITKEYFEVETNETLVNGDGICFFDKSGNLQGMNINKIEDDRIYFGNSSGLSVGMKIFRNYDHVFYKKLLTDKTVRKVEVFINVADSDFGFVITATDEDGNRVEQEYIVEKIPSENPKKILETIEKQFRKTGETVFSITEIKLNLDTPYFIPASKLNEMRRTILELLNEERIKKYPRKFQKSVKSEIAFPQNELDFRGNVVNEKAKEFYSKHGVEKMDDGFELSDEFAGKIIMTTKFCIKNELGMCPQKEDAKKTNYKEPLFLKDKNRRYKLIFNCKECEMNIMLD